ncbi:MAG: hypothetical protein WDN69_10740 [Aliidongia sp.]
MAFIRVVHRAEEFGFLEQRHELLRFGRREQLGMHAEIAALGMGHAQEIHPLRRAGQHEAAGEMQPAGLARDRFDLLVKLDRVALQLGDIGIAVQSVEAAGSVPGRTGCQLLPFQQHDVAPAGLGQVIEHAAPDDAAPDDDDLCLSLHGLEVPSEILSMTRVLLFFSSPPQWGGEERLGIRNPS